MPRSSLTMEAALDVSLGPSLCSWCGSVPQRLQLLLLSLAALLPVLPSSSMQASRHVQ